MIDEILSFATRNELPFDLPVGYIAAVRNGYYIVNRPLVKHRIHRKNLSSPQLSVQSRLNNLSYLIDSRVLKLRHLWPVLKEYGHLMTDADKAGMETAIRICESSIRALEAGDSWELLKIALHRYPMVNQWVSINNWLACCKEKVRERT